MIKKIRKLNIVVLIALIILTTLSFAYVADASLKSNMKTGFNTTETKINPNTKKVTGEKVYTSTKSIVNIAIGVVQLVGVGIAVIMLIVLAIKYISASAGDKAEIKKHAVVYIVGAVVLFGAAGILGIIKNFAFSLSE